MTARRQVWVTLLLLCVGSRAWASPGSEHVCESLEAQLREAERGKENRAARLRAVVETLQKTAQDITECPQMLPSVRHLVVELNEVGDYHGASRVCGVLEKTFGLGAEDFLSCAVPSLRLGHIEQAMRNLRRYIETCGRDGRDEAVLKAAAVLEDVGRFEAAESILALGDSSDRKVWLRRLHNILRAGNSAQAAALVDEGLRNDSLRLNTTALREACVLLASYGEVRSAQAVAKALLQAGSFGETEADAVVLVAGKARDTGLAEMAARRLEAAMPSKPGLVAALLERHSFDGLALQTLERAFESKALSDEEDFIAFARLLIREGRRDRAVKVLTTLITSGTRVPWNVITGLLLDAGLRVEAERLLKLKESTQDQEWVKAYGRVLQAAGREDEEEALYLRTAEALEEQQRYGFWRAIGANYRVRGDTLRATKAFEAALKYARSKSEEAQAHLDIAEIVLGTKNGVGIGEAAQRMTLALELAPEDEAVRSRTLGILSNVDEPPIQLLEALVAAKGDAQDYARLANAYLANRYHKKAVSAFIQAIERADKEARKSILEQAVIRLFAQEAGQYAVYLLSYYERRFSLASGLPQSFLLFVGNTCARLGDRACVARVMGLALEGPLEPDVDYEEVARTCAGLGLFKLADKAIEMARRALGPESRWIADVAAGWLALLRGRDEAAKALFLRTSESAEGVEAKMAIAESYQETGRLREAARWWSLAYEASGPQERGEIAEKLVEVLVRLGDCKAIQGLVERIVANDEPLAWSLLSSLEDSLCYDVAVWFAKTLATRKIAEAEVSGQDLRVLWPAYGLDVLDRVVSLIVRSGELELAKKVVVLLCSESDWERGCLNALNTLHGSFSTSELLEILEHDCTQHPCSEDAVVQIATLRLVQGDIARAFDLAMAAVKECDNAEKVVYGLQPLLWEARAYNEYLTLLDGLRACAEFREDTQILLEMAKANLASGEIEGALFLMAGYLAQVTGGEREVFDLLCSFGLRNRALRILEESPETSLEALKPDDFAGLVDNLWEHGDENVLEKLLEKVRRFQDPGKRVFAAGWILLRLGRSEEALKVSRSIDPRNVDGDVVLGLMDLHLALGDAFGAADLAQTACLRNEKALVVSEKYDIKVCESVAERLLGANMVSQAWYLVEPLREWLDPNFWRFDLPLPDFALGMVRLGRQELVEPALEVFLSSLWDKGTVDDRLAGFVAEEVARGRVGEFLAALDGFGAGYAVLEAKVLAACLANDEKKVREGLDALLGSEDEPNLGGYLRAARTLLRCGRFREAYEVALRGLGYKQGGLKVVEDLAVEAVRSGLAAGFTDALEKVEMAIRNGFEDQISLTNIRAVLREAAADYRGQAELVAGRGDDQFAVALKAGERTLMWRAADIMLAKAGNRREVVLDIVDTAKNGFREDFVVSFLMRERGFWPKDPQVAKALLEAFVWSAPAEQVLKRLEEYALILGNEKAAYVELVKFAAEALRVDLLDEAVGRVMEMTAKQEYEVAQALLSAAIAYARAGENTKARAAASRGMEASLDVGEYMFDLSKAALGDPSIPLDLWADLLEEGLASLGARGRPKPAAMLRCLALPIERFGECIAMVANGTTDLLVLLLRRLLIERKYAHAIVLLDIIRKKTYESSKVLEVAIPVFGALWLHEQSPGAKDIAKTVLQMIREKGGYLSKDYLWLEAGLVDVAEGRGKGAKAFEQFVRLNPASGLIRNNFAYYLSVGGVDAKRALTEARIAVALSSENHPFSLETEAWAYFLNGHVQEGWRLQEQCRNLWRRDQMGGLAESFLHLGKMYEALKRYKEAAEAYRRAATTEPLEVFGQEGLSRWRNLRQVGCDETSPRKNRLCAGP